MGKKDGDGGVQVPADLSGLSDDELTSLHSQAKTEFQTLTDDPNINAVGLERATELADVIETMATEINARALARRQAAAEALRGRVTARAVDDLQPSDGDGDGGGGDGGNSGGGNAGGNTGGGTGGNEGEGAVTASSRTRGRTPVENVIKSGSKLNVRLSSAQQSQRAPTGAVRSGVAPRDATVVVASADIRGFTQGSNLDGIDALAAAMQARARTMPVTHGTPNYTPVAQLQRDQDFRWFVDDHSSPEEVHRVLQEAANPEALVAAGGWCAPSEISYDFYNVVCEDGMYDLPSTGVRRGGMRWPTSPSFGDLASSTGLWIWNETQDIAAATGTGQSGTKTCARVPCASFNEARLECDGICITAGNLTSDAWPEQIANFMRLVMAAHAHRVNTRVIGKVAALSTAVSMCATGMGVAVPLLDAVELQAIDIRTKYAMCDNATLEAVFPNWVLGLIRADLAKRKGWDSPGAAFNITNAEIAAWFTLRGISAQFVQDWQVRATGFPGLTGAITTWPTTVQFLIYPAGTFVKGNGLSLDLGVVRDSTLNATNDFTAAWSEDCWLVAMIGHESRLVTVPVCPNGAAGADVTFTCPTC
jgi:hypothetical protein